MDGVSFPKIRPKITIRNAEGGGRDTYITADNGDNCNDKSRFTHLQKKENTPSRFLRMKPHTMIRPRHEPKTLAYIQDGSGRDSYVQHNHGG